MVLINKSNPVFNVPDNDVFWNPASDNTFKSVLGIRSDPDPTPFFSLDPDLGGPKTCGSCGSGSPNTALSTHNSYRYLSTLFIFKITQVCGLQNFYADPDRSFLL